MLLSYVGITWFFNALLSGKHLDEATAVESSVGKEAEMGRNLSERTGWLFHVPCFRQARGVSASTTGGPGVIWKRSDLAKGSCGCVFRSLMLFPLGPQTCLCQVHGRHWPQPQGSPFGVHLGPS